MRLAEGAWALAVYEDADVRKRITEKLKAAIKPIPVVEVSLLNVAPDPLGIIRNLDAEVASQNRQDPKESEGETDGNHPREAPAPVVVFTDVHSALSQDLCGYLDLQREALARLPHRLLFWVTDYDQKILARQAPNFYSRLSGVFRFPGMTAAATRDSPPRGSQESRGSEAPMPLTWRRPRIEVRDEKERRRRIKYYKDRISALTSMAEPDAVEIAESWYDLGGLYADAKQPAWRDAEHAFSSAAHHFGEVGDTFAQAEALLQAGYAAYRAYQPHVAMERLEHALNLYFSLELSPSIGRQIANTFQAIGDVQQFRKEMEAALQSYDQALSLYRAVGSRLGEANTLQAMGEVQRFQDQYEAALQSYDQALSLYRAVGDRLGEANTLKAIGEVQRFQRSI